MSLSSNHIKTGVSSPSLQPTPMQPPQYSQPTNQPYEQDKEQWQYHGQQQASYPPAPQQPTYPEQAHAPFTEHGVTQANGYGSEHFQQQPMPGQQQYQQMYQQPQQQPFQQQNSYQSPPQPTYQQQSYQQHPQGEKFNVQTTITPVLAQTNFQNAIPLNSLNMSSAPIDCPMCHQRRMTRTLAVAGNTTHAWAGVTFCLTGCLCFIPYLMDSIKDVQHRCGNCGVHVATWHKSGQVEVLAYA